MRNERLEGLPSKGDWKGIILWEQKGFRRILSVGVTRERKGILRLPRWGKFESEV
jgi:hypothetical protein